MKAGELNRQITFQTGTSTQNENGYPVTTWADAITGIWAAVVTTGGGEFYSAQKVNAETTCLFKIRYRTDVNTSMRIIYETRTFEILALNDVGGMHVDLYISAREVV